MNGNDLWKGLLSVAGFVTTDPPDDASLTPVQRRTARFRVAGGRENVEALVVAFILALIFRAFLAEAFVIPTGSMAPTLMGAHKDLYCDACGHRFPVGASHEATALNNFQVVVGGVCPNCRFVNPLDLANESDEQTFNGDRIVVNKFSYALGDPKRWDVIVFKFPGNPKQNYIKRLVGLPGETITVRHGDVYRTTDSVPQTILRKDPTRQLAMSHDVYDTDRQADVLTGAGYPARWQPWRPGAEAPPEGGWKVRRTPGQWTAELDAAGEQHWLRYYHHWAGSDDWAAAMAGQSLAGVDPYQSRAVTDFYSYNSALTVNMREVYSRYELITRWTRRFRKRSFIVAEFQPTYESGGDLSQFRSLSGFDFNDMDGVHDHREGVHWVGDLMVTADVSIDDDASTFVVELVKAGVKHQAVLEPRSGTVTLRMLDGMDDDRELPFDAGMPTANVGVLAGGSHQIRLSNYDHAMTLWIDGKVVAFEQPTTFDPLRWRDWPEDRPFVREDHPLDASPVGIAADGPVRIERISMQRDQYYIATKFGPDSNDYDPGFTRGTLSIGQTRDIQDLFGQPERWDEFDWTSRRKYSFRLGEDQYFPMGDNSPGSLDARSWAGTKGAADAPPELVRRARRWHGDHFVTRDLLVGRAVGIFWPHSWNRPVPFWPNWERFVLIR